MHLPAIATDPSDMKRKFFTFCALVSLLLFAATAWWWSSSRNRIDQLSFEKHGSQAIRLWGSGGKLLVTRTVYPPAPTPGSGALSWSSTAFNASDPKTPGDPRLTLASFSYASQPLADKPGGKESTLVLPAWLLTLVFALLPALWVGSKMKRKKKPAGN